MQPHDVQQVQAGEQRHEHRRDDREVLRDVVGDRERRQRATGDQQLLADLDDLDELGRVGVEVDHVAGLLGRRRAGVHRDADVGLRERGRVVGAVAGHRDQLAALLLLLDQRHLVLGRGLGEEVVDAGLVGNGLGGQRVVAGDHHRPDAHPAHLVEPLAHALLDDVLEVDDARARAAVAVLLPRRPPAGCRPRRRCRRRSRRVSAGTVPPWSRTQSATELAAPLRELMCRPSRSTPDIRVCGGELDPRARGRARPVCGPAGRSCCLANTTIERPSGVSSARLDSCAASASCSAVTPRQREEVGGLPVAQRDGAGLVEQQRVDVAGGLDRAARHGQHVALHQPVHAGDADGRQQRADRRRDQADQQRDHHDAGDAVAVERQACPGRRGCSALEKIASGCRVATANTKMIVSAASRMFSAISFGVFCRLAPSTSAIIRSMKLSPGFCVILTTMRSDSTVVPPVTADAVAAGLADHRRGLAGDGRLVDRGDAFHDVAVARDDLSRLDDDDVALLQQRRRRPPLRAPGAPVASRRDDGPWWRSSSCAVIRPAPCRGPRRPPRPGWRKPLSATAIRRSARRTTTGSMIARIVLQTAPISTMNMTGLRHSVRGSSLRSAPGSRLPQHLRVEQATLHAACSARLVFCCGLAAESIVVR